MSDPILHASGLKKDFDGVSVIRDASLSLNGGEFVSLVGRSGSGKTTLLSLLSTLDVPTAGEVTLCGMDVASASETSLALFRRRNIGLIFQSFHLLPTLTAWENVAVPLFPEPMRQEERRELAVGLLNRMGLGNRLDHLPGELSGGERQRVAIARAMVNCPKIIFADEPTGSLDSATGEEIMEILHDVSRNGHVAILMVTHDMPLAERADRMLTMHDGVLK